MIANPFDDLPTFYAEALRLLAQGRTADDVAELMGVEPAAFPALVELGLRKALEAHLEARPTWGPENA